MKRSVAAALAALSFASCPAHAEQEAALGGGVIPEGVWILNRERSVELMPGAQTLWVVKDDGRVLIWVNVFRDDQGRARVTSYEGHYDGDAAPVLGAAMQSRITSPGAGRIHNFGEIAGMGPYAEDCEVLANGKRFLCHGHVTTPEGEKRWTDDFEWVAPSPDKLVAR